MLVNSNQPLDAWQLTSLSKIDAKRPTPAEAKATFMGLKDKKWMQMIDGKYHRFGPKVF